MSQHRPTIATSLSAAITFLLLTIADEVLAAVSLSAQLETAIMGLVLALVGVVGVAAGKIAERLTWSEDSYKQAVLEAAKADPGRWRDVARRLGAESQGSGAWENGPQR